MEQYEEAGDGAAFAVRRPDGSLTHSLTRCARARSACAPRSWKCPRCPIFNFALGNAQMAPTQKAWQRSWSSWARR